MTAGKIRAKLFEGRAPEFGIEIEFPGEGPANFTGDTIVLHLAKGTSLDDAEQLVRDLNRYGDAIQIT